MMAALTAARHIDTILVTDGPLGRANSAMAQGGLHVPLPGGEDSMVGDMVRSARDAVDAERIAGFVAGIAPTVDTLVEWGLHLDREPDGTVRRIVAGGLTEARIVTSGDGIGREVMRVLRSRTEGSPRLTVLPSHQVVDIESGPSLVLAGGGVIGVRAVVVATGGTAHARAVREGVRSTNPPNRNHELLDALRTRGVATTGDDLFQYQPFGLLEAGGTVGRCVPESVASLGVRLVDRSGAAVVDPALDRLEVTRAIESAVARGKGVETGGGIGVTMSLSDLDPAILEQRYPALLRTLSAMDRVGSDVVVRPFLHYFLGGLAVDEAGATSLDSVYAAGEAVGGLHGRNRLMGAGITDALVNGRVAGEAAAGVSR